MVFVDRRTSQSTSVVRSFCAASLLVARSPQAVSSRACTWAVVKSSWRASSRPTTSAVSRKNGYARAVIPQCSQMRSWPADPRQQGHGPVPQGQPFRGDAAPDAQDDPDALGPRLLARQFFLQGAVEEGTQFGLVGRLGEPVQHRVQPRPLDLPVDANDFPHSPSLAIATNGTITSSRAMPPWATTSSPYVRERFEVARQQDVPGRRQAVARPAEGSGNLAATSSRNSGRS